MMVFLPEPYEDELLYSWFARYYIRSGYMKYVFVADDLFQRRTTVPAIEFMNVLTPDAVRCIEQIKPLSSVVMENTLYPHYARFLPREKRFKAYRSLIDMDGKYFNLLPVPNIISGATRFLRYCPLCANDDRESYGEAYWHRVHQLGIPVCPKHHCLLQNSGIPLKTSVSPNFFPAELSIPKVENSVLSGRSIDIRVAHYVRDVFSEEFDFSADISATDCFLQHMVGTPYLSVRGEKRNLSLLLSDFNYFYQGLSIPHITEWAQMQKLFQGMRQNPLEICLMGMFLQIPPVELTHITIQKLNIAEQYDNQIRELHSQGMKYTKIAMQVGGSYEYVKAIGEGRKGNHKKRQRKRS